MNDTVTEDLTTNATNSTLYEPPKTSDSHLERCPEHYEKYYCLNGGQCNWVSGIAKPSCECINDFEGARCDLKTLPATEARMFGDYWEVFVIGTLFGIVILLTLIIAVVYVYWKRKQAQRTQSHYQRQHAEEFIQQNYPVNGRSEYQPDANQNTSSDKYAPIPTSEPQALLGTVVTDENETLETAFANSKTSSTNSFKLQDPPLGRKSSSQSTRSNKSASKESTV